MLHAVKHSVRRKMMLVVLATTAVALLLMGAILWGFGHVLQTFFPALLKLKIMIYVPQL